MITAFGLPWCKEEPVAIGLSSAVAHILCGRHNSQLSPFDSEAAQLSRFLAQHVCHEPLAEGAIRLNGPRLEKWALKTLFNLGYVRGLHHGQATRLDPPEHLVRYIYREEPVAHGVGLYLVSSRVSNENYTTGLRWNAIHETKNPERIVGMTFVLSGARFIVSTYPIRGERHFVAMGRLHEFDFSMANVVYRPPGIGMKSATAGEKRIEFEW